MTEQEAKTKRCCGSSACGEPQEVRKDTSFEGYSQRFCVGSACMAWREGNTYAGGIPLPPSGFCGLAGKP